MFFGFCRCASVCEMWTFPFQERIELSHSAAATAAVLLSLMFCCCCFYCHRCCCCCFWVILQMPLVCHGLFHLLVVTYVHVRNYFSFYFFPYFDRRDFNYLDRTVCLVVCTADGIRLFVCLSAYVHLFVLDFSCSVRAHA